jgi:UDPglucose 6-dehydrogenase
MANICVTGIWHQGAVVSACLADLGHQVRGVCDQETARLLNNGKAPVYEPDLSEIIQRNYAAGRLKYTVDIREGLEGAEFVFISTDTPVDMQDESDLSSIYALAEDIGNNLAGNIVLCVTAQVPLGTSEELAKTIKKLAPGFECKVAYIPEFLRLGIAVETFRNADRFVIGCNDSQVSQRIAELYRPLGRPLLQTDIRSAEMGKHAANAFLSMSISFINEIANLCELLQADALEVAKILKSDKRIGPYAFLSPGLGFAGGTLGREIRALQKFGRQYQISMPLMDAVWRINAERYQLVGRRLTGILGSLKDRKIGILGLTYKAGTSTMRRAISLDIIRDLLEHGAHISSFAPLANLDEVTDMPPIDLCKDPFEAARGSSALVLVTEWNGIETLNWAKVKANMVDDVMLDTRNLLDPILMKKAGFRYFGIGSSCTEDQCLPMLFRTGGGS